MAGKIYCFTSPSDKSYVGQTLEENVLGKNGRYPYATCSKGQRHFYNAIQKYGLLDSDVWKMMLLVDGLETQEDVNAAERYFIKSLNTMAPNGYNLTEGGCGGKPSKETRAKISAAGKGRPGPNKGKTLSAETRAKISAAGKGKPKSAKHRVKISNANKGKSRSAATCANISAAKRGKRAHNKGKSPSAATRAKMSIANKGRIVTNETRGKLSAASVGERNHFFGKRHSTESRAKISCHRRHGKLCECWRNYADF